MEIAGIAHVVKNQTKIYLIILLKAKKTGNTYSFLALYPQKIFMQKNLSFTLAILLIVGLFCSCNTNKEVKNDVSYQLVLQDSAYIPVDSLTPFTGNDLQYVKAGEKEYVVLLNKRINAIQIYSWQSKEMLKRIYLEKEGPNGVGEATYMFVHSLDSIFVLTSYLYKVSLVNAEGKLLQKYSLLSKSVKFDESKGYAPKVSENDYAGLPWGGVNAMFVANNELYMGCVPSINPFIKEHYERGLLGMKVNLATKQIDYFMPFPRIYRDKMFFPLGYTHSTSCYNPIKNTLVYSFPCDAKVYEMDLNTNKIVSYLANSSYFKEIEIFSTNPAEDPNRAEKEFDFAISHASFERIRYDPYRKIYYRNILLPNTKKKEENDWHPFLVCNYIILDENFKTLGEVQLPEHVGTSYYFVNEEGLFLQGLSRNEDEICFYRYELVKGNKP